MRTCSTPPSYSIRIHNHRDVDLHFLSISNLHLDLSFSFFLGRFPFGILAFAFFFRYF